MEGWVSQSGSMCPRTQVELVIELPPVSPPRGPRLWGGVWESAFYRESALGAFPALGAFAQHPP